MSQHALTTAKETLLLPYSLSEEQLNSLMDYLLSYKIDAADLYFQRIYQESWKLENELVKQGSFDIEQGVGMRAISGAKSGFAYSENLRFPILMQAAQSVRNITQQRQDINPIAIKAMHKANPLYPVSDNPLTTFSDQDKLALLYPINRVARGISQYVSQVNAVLKAQYEIILLVRHDGQLLADIRPLLTMHVSVIAERHGRREQAYAIETLRGDYSHFTNSNIPMRLVQEAVAHALLNLEAKPAPAGTMPVVLGPGNPGILIHEAVGHGLEGDFNRKASSTFSGRIGQSVASPLCTIIDDGALAGHVGSLNMDDEGTPTQSTTLIKKGILKDYMQDNLNAKLMQMQSTGNCRRESYQYLPMPRMTNTYIQQGETDPEAIVSSVKSGLYAADFSGGQVDITSGKFVFSASKAFMIENGKITHPVKGATLIGHGPDVLHRISAVGNDLIVGKAGWCGKDGQTVPVSVGQPTLKVDALTIGGTA